MPYVPVSGRRIWRAFLDKLFPALRRQPRRPARPAGCSRPRLEALEDRMAPAALAASLPNLGNFSVPISIVAPRSGTSTGTGALTIAPGKITTVMPLTPPIAVVNGNAPGAPIKVSTPSPSVILFVPPTSPLTPLPASPGSAGSSGSAGTTGASSASGTGSNGTGSSAPASSGASGTTAAVNTPAPGNAVPSGIFVPTGKLTLPGVPVTSPVGSGLNGAGSSASGTGSAFTQQTGSSVAVSGGSSVSGSSPNSMGPTVPIFASGIGGGVYVPQGQLSLAASIPSQPSPTPGPTVDLSSSARTPEVTPAVTTAVNEPPTDTGLSAAPGTSSGAANGGSYTLLAGSSNTASSVSPSTQVTNPQPQGSDHSTDASTTTDATAPTTSDSASPMGGQSVQPVQWSAL